MTSPDQSETRLERTIRMFKQLNVDIGCPDTDYEVVEKTTAQVNLFDRAEAGEHFPKAQSSLYDADQACNYDYRNDNNDN